MPGQHAGSSLIDEALTKPIRTVLQKRPIEKLLYGLKKYGVSYTVSGISRNETFVDMTVILGDAAKVRVRLLDGSHSRSGFTEAEIFAMADNGAQTYSTRIQSISSDFAMQIADAVREGIAAVLEQKSNTVIGYLVTTRGPKADSAARYLKDYAKALEADYECLHDHLSDIFKATTMEAFAEGCHTNMSSTKAADTGQPVAVFSMRSKRDGFERFAVHAQFQDDDSDDIKLRAAFESSRQFKDVTMLEAIAMADEWLDKHRSGTLPRFIPGLD